MKYTYYGDTDLNGQVDGADYSRIDHAYIQNQSHPGLYTGWFNGDLNYDGVIDGSDYTLIDNAFNAQGAVLSTEIAGTPAIATAELAGAVPTSSVPEPVSSIPEPAGAIAAGALAGLLGRRSRAVRSLAPGAIERARLRKH